MYSNQFLKKEIVIQGVKVSSQGHKTINVVILGQDLQTYKLFPTLHYNRKLHIFQS